MFNKIAIQFFRYTVLLVIKVDVGLFRFKHFFNSDDQTADGKTDLNGVKR